MRPAKAKKIQSNIIGDDKEYEVETTSLSIHEGIIFGTLVVQMQDRETILLMFTPQMNGHEEKLAKEIGAMVVPFAFTNGIRNGFRYLKAQFQG